MYLHILGIICLLFAFTVLLYKEFGLKDSRIFANRNKAEGRRAFELLILSIVFFIAGLFLLLIWYFEHN
jgi:UPF0716 family protein affecting phage T7 exclusion